MKEGLFIIFMLFVVPVLLYFLLMALINWMITFLPSAVIFGIITAVAGGVLYYFYKKEVE